MRQAGHSGCPQARPHLPPLQDHSPGLQHCHPNSQCLTARVQGTGPSVAVMTNGLLRAHSGNQTLSPWDPESLRALGQALLAVVMSLSDLLTTPLQDRL